MKKHLQFSNLVAVSALFFALGGTAVAASKYLITSTSQISPKVLKALKGAHGARGAAGPRGVAGTTGTAGAAGATGPAGAAGPIGPAGAARAYGWMSSNTALDAARSKGVVLSGHPSTGIYCFTAAGIDPTTTTIVVSADFANSGTSTTIAQVRYTNLDCPVGQFDIRVWDAAAVKDAQFSFIII